MKKLINEPDDVVREALEGMVAATGDLIGGEHDPTTSCGPTRRSRARWG